jgi:hypothetical protein
MRRRDGEGATPAGSIVSPLVLLVAVAVDVGAEVVAVVAIAGNVWCSTFTSGACASPLPQPRSSRAARAHARPTRGGPRVS